MKTPRNPADSSIASVTAGGRTQQWAEGGAPEDLSQVQKTVPTKKARDVFMYFIGAAKERNPAGAMALQERVDNRR
jgi:hypothetical protein